MNKELLIKAMLILTVLLTSVSSFAQLPPFTFTATPTPQTCLGNGTISFTVSGTQAGATMDYAVYLLPNTTTPVATVTTPSIGSLVAGTYQIIATQSLGGQTSTSTATVVITNQVVPLEYSMSLTNVRCGTDGVITVNITAGTAQAYEIIAGPVTRPVQTSNVFNNLPIGVYQVRIFDTCGNANVVTVQLIADLPMVVVQPVSFPGGQLPDCNTINISHLFITTANHFIFYPLTFEYTVFPPGGGAPIVITQTGVIGGNITQAIPFYHNQQYTYNIEVTDACGNTFVRNNNVVNQQFTAQVQQNTDNCADYSFKFIPNNFVAPITVNFTTVPAGFSPTAFNALHPTFANPDLSTYGGPGNAVPEGAYTAQITDGCGRTATVNFEVTPPELNPEIIPTVTGCTATTGDIDISIPGRAIVTIVLTAAPAAYTNPLPHSYTASIVGGELSLIGLPLGTYTFTMTDQCGDEYIDEDGVLEPSSSGVSATVNQRPGCAIGEGSIRMENASGAIASVIITAAPAAFGETLPYDASANIAATGIFFMNSLPEGAYTFSITDECGGTGTKDVTVNGYTITVNTFTLTENCNSFNLNIQNTSNGTNVQAFWLQMLDEDTGSWVHPQTGNVYTPGTAPNTSNSTILSNNTTTLSILSQGGHYRIVKSFYVYSNGSNANFLCTQVMNEFDYQGGPRINDTFGFPCANNTTEVAIEAVGMAPLTYTIVDNVDNDLVLVDNGTLNTFGSLATGTYTFRVEDVCGNYRTIQVNVNELEPFEIEGVNLCEGESGQLSVTPFSFLTYEWYRDDNPTVILSTTSVLDIAPFDSDIHADTYHVRVTSNNPASCINNEVFDYVVNANMLANAGNDDAISYCNDGQEINLASYLSNPHDEDGVWTDVNGSGALTDNLLTTEGLAEGTYQFIYTVNGQCDSVDEATLTFEIKNIPGTPVVTPVAPVCEGENVQLATDAVANATYEWNGPGGFTSQDQNPLLEQAAVVVSGTYQVRVTVNGCVSPPQTVNVAVNALPDFSIDGNSVLCRGQIGELSVMPDNFDPIVATYEWYHDGVLQDGVTAPDIEIFETGNYRVVVSNNGCSTEQVMSVVENTNAFAVELEAGCVNFEYVVSVVNADELTDVAYEWSGPGGYSAVGSEITITNGLPGDYTVIATNLDGCAVSSAVNVPNTSCMIPRGISPGDADYNNNFDLSNLDVQHLSIFNRYGLKVYEKENYKDEWYGQSDKGELPTGTYYYVVTLSAGKRVSGWVYLQRHNN